MPIQYEVSDGVATFTIENGKVNAFTPAMHRALHDALTAFLRDRSAKVGILTGAGSRAFSAGDDIKTPRRAQTAEQKVVQHFDPLSQGEHDAAFPGWEQAVLTLKRFKPIIGAVNGWCLGEGLIFLLHLTDIRVAGATARFGLPEIALGMGGGGAMARIHRHLPRTVAMQLMLTGQPMDAAEALRCHLVNEVVAEDQVMGRARALARTIAAHPALAIRAEMEAFVRAEELDGENAFAMAGHIFRLQRLALGDHTPVIENAGNSAPE